MCNVLQENRSLQCAFLIDVNAENLLNDIKPSELSNAIRLCALRILTYFSDKLGKGNSNLRWGYKFYNSGAITHLYERHEFREFRVEYFEEFEQDICKRLDESFDKEIQVKNSDIQDGGVHVSSCQKPSPAKCLTCALTDLVHDFEWEQPEISSPFKRPRRVSQANDVNNNSSTNFVFLFSWCPCSKGLMSSFCDRSIKSCENFRNVVLPSALHKKFRGNCKISLLWVDTGLWWWRPTQQVLKDWNCKSLVQEFTKSLGGCLIPLSALVHLETFNPCETVADAETAQNNDIAAEVNFCRGITHCGILLPFASVMNYFLYQCDIGLADLESKTSCSVVGADSWTGLLCTTGNSEIIHCTVKLNPIFNHISLGAPEDSSLSNGRNSNEDQAAVFWIQGVIERQELCPSWLHPTKSYSCVGFATNGPSFSGWFQELMAALSKQNLLLVIDFPDPSNGLPVTGVMQPLTSISGVLSVTNPDAMLRVEKLLLWHGKRAAGAVDPPGDVDNSDPTDGERVSKKQHSQSTRGNAVKENMGVAKAGSIFSASDLNPLHSRRNSAASISLLEELTSISLQEDSDDGEDESELVRQLRELYSKKKKHSLSGSRKTKHHKEEDSGKECQTRKQRKSQKPGSRDRSASSKEKSRKRKSAELSSVSCAEIQTEVERQTPGAADEVEKAEVAEKQQPMAEFQDKDELIQHLKEVYSTMVAQDLESKAPDVARQLVEATVQFSTLHYPKDAEVETRSVMDENLLVKHHNLREKYEGQEDAGVKQHKQNEYHLQVLLRMELAAAVKPPSSEQQLIDEVTGMLRTISFLKDPGFLVYYLREELLRRYGKLIPKFVCGVYEGLMQDPPDELLSPSKRNVEESPARSAKPASITTQDSQEPRSEGCRVFTRHKSVTDLGKRREIVVPGKAKSKASQKQVKQAAKKAKKEAPKTPVKKVRRNLFTGAEGEEPAKEQVRQGQPKGGEVRQQSNRRHYVAGTLKTVQETPARKQIANALWRRQHRARKRASTMTDVEVVQESPLKQLQEGEPLPRRSPRRHKGSVVFQRSQSFYGRSASAIPLTRTKSFTATSVRESPAKSPEFENMHQPKESVSLGLPTVESNASKTPMKTLAMASKVVSPLRFSPRLRKRFSLHSLLKTTMDSTSSDSVSTRKGKGNAIPKTPDSKKPQGLRSSPRLLKRRSFSCIGFSSTASSEKHQRTRSQIQGLTEAAPITTIEPQSKNAPVGIPVSTAPSRQELVESSELNSAIITQPSTPDNAIPQDDIESFITPVKQVASSPVRFSPAPSESDSPQSLKKASTRSRKKPLKRTSLETKEEPPIIQKRKVSNSSPSRSLRKRVSPNCDSSPSERNDPAAISKINFLSPSRLHRSSSSERPRLQQSCNITPSKKVRSSSFPVKVSDSTANCGTQNMAEEALSPRKNANEDTNAASRRLERRPTQRPTSNEEQVTPAEKPASSKSAICTTTQDIVNEKSTEYHHVEEAIDIQQSPGNKKRRSSGNLRSPGSGEIAKGDIDTSCPTDVLQLSDGPLKPCAVYLSPLRILSNGSPKDSKASVSSRTPISTPPMKRSRGSRSLGSPTDRKRLSPLNQILKQRKPKHQGFNKSPVAKGTSLSPESVHSGFSSPVVASPNTKKAARNGKRKKSPRLTFPLSKRRTAESPDNSRNISRSSDEGNDWLDEIEMDQQRCTSLCSDDVLCEKEQSTFESDSSPTFPCSKKRRIDKSVVFGGKNFKKPHPKHVSFSGSCSKSRRRSSDAFDGDPDDDVFQSLVSVSIPLKRTKIPSTPLSLSSIKQLQESPILFGSPKSIFNTSPSKFRISPSSLTRKWTEFCPDSKSNDQHTRLRLRKHSKTNSEPRDTETDVLLTDQTTAGTESGENKTEVEQKATRSFKLRKRLQLAH